MILPSAGPMAPIATARCRRTPRRSGRHRLDELRVRSRAASRATSSGPGCPPSTPTVERAPLRSPAYRSSGRAADPEQFIENRPRVIGRGRHRVPLGLEGPRVARRRVSSTSMANKLSVRRHGSRRWAERHAKDHRFVVPSIGSLDHMTRLAPPAPSPRHPWATRAASSRSTSGGTPSADRLLRRCGARECIAE